jgi:uncharacterized membrane protein
MRLQMLMVGIGIMILIIGGILAGVGFGEYISCTSSFSCSSPAPAALLVLGEVVFFVGIIVTIIGAVLARIWRKPPFPAETFFRMVSP